MGEQTLTLKKAWMVYDRWLEDARVEFHPEPRGIEAALREATKPYVGQPASKLIGDCYLVAYAHQTGSALVTFDAALHALAQKQGNRSVMPA
jgi:predicted nucleic acid-binding protein